MDGAKIPLEWIQEVEAIGKRTKFTKKETEKIDLFLKEYYDKITMRDMWRVLKKTHGKISYYWIQERCRNLKLKRDK